MEISFFLTSSYISGNVELINNQGQRIRTYYSNGDAERVDWYEEDKESGGSAWGWKNHHH